MKRLLVRIAQGLVTLLVVLYLGDLIGWSVRSRAEVSSTVQVEQFLRTPLKGRKEEFDYMGMVDQPCVRAIFPHHGEIPCWWLERHKIQWISP
ncbi:MAG: hypothetical protein WA510_18795 [Acidobacteriaceae bacterium]